MAKVNPPREVVDHKSLNSDQESQTLLTEDPSNADSGGEVSPNTIEVDGHGAVPYEIPLDLMKIHDHAPIDPSQVTMARMGMIRTPTDDIIETKQGGGLKPPMDTPSTNSEASSLLRTQSQYGARIDEPDYELIDSKLSSENQGSRRSVNPEANRAVFPSSPPEQRVRDVASQWGNHRSASVHSTIASEKSNVTDLGSSGLRIAYRNGRPRPDSWVVDEPESSIEDQLMDILEPIPGDGRMGFFPEEQLDALINRKCVEAELERIGMTPEDAQENAGIVCGIGVLLDPVERAVYKKIFATLVLSRGTSAILSFIKHSVADDDLPLREVPLQPERRKRFGFARRKGPAIALDIFNDWTKLDLKRFGLWQWSSLAPFFHRGLRNDVKHYTLKDQSYLPFTANSRFPPTNSPNERREIHGGSSYVFKVSIHPEHHSFQAKKHSRQKFAVKCLTSDDRDMFKKEVSTLMKFSNDTHTHLVSLLATYELCNTFYLIFHWAEGDLRDYWMNRNPTPLTNYDTIRWVAEQSWGVADGLSTIHSSDGIATIDSQSEHDSDSVKKKVYGRHGDIKPQNILWFLDPDDKAGRGTLKITDFGLTKFSINHSRSYELSTELATSPSYRPPEYDLKGGLIGRSYDIWTLGCVYLEHVTWLLGGWNNVQAFFNKRDAFDPILFGIHSDTFFEIVRCKSTDDTLGAMIKPQVTTFISELHGHQSCTEYIHDFLTIIQKEMLVVKSPNPEGKVRIDCTTLKDKLRVLYERCESDRQYASQPVPRENDHIVEVAIEVDVSTKVASVLQHVELRVYDGKTVPRLAPEISLQSEPASTA